MGTNSECSPPHAMHETTFKGGCRSCRGSQEQPLALERPERLTAQGQAALRALPQAGLLAEAAKSQRGGLSPRARAVKAFTKPPPHTPEGRLGRQVSCVLEWVGRPIAGVELRVPPARRLHGLRRQHACGETMSDPWGNFLDRDASEIRFLVRVVQHKAAVAVTLMFRLEAGAWRARPGGVWSAPQQSMMPTWTASFSSAAASALRQAAHSRDQTPGPRMVPRDLEQVV